MAQTPTYLKSLKKESVVQSVINRLTDAMRANNLGRPLAYDSNHEITQQIRNIISKIVA